MSKVMIPTNIDQLRLIGAVRDIEAAAGRRTFQGEGIPEAMELAQRYADKCGLDVNRVWDMLDEELGK